MSSGRILAGVAFWGGISVCTWLALVPDPPATGVFSVGDVVLHAAAFIYLSITLALFLRSARSRPLPWSVLSGAGLALLAYGLAIEIGQLFVAERSAELKDLVVDAGGIVVGLLAARWLDDRGWLRVPI